MVVYHGSGVYFNEFKSADIGIWFAKEKHFASNFGSIVNSLYVKIQNPLEISEATERYSIAEWGSIFQETAGVEGVVFDSGLSNFEDYAFNELLPNKGNSLNGDGNLLELVSFSP